MTDRLFADCCYGSENQHLVGTPCSAPVERARIYLADTLDLAGYNEDAEHLRKPKRVGDVLVPHTVAVAAMMAFSGDATPPSTGDAVREALGFDPEGLVAEARVHMKDMPKCIQRDYLRLALEKIERVAAALNHGGSQP